MDELEDWLFDPYWRLVYRAADDALDTYPDGGITTRAPRWVHPVLFTADVLHAMSLLAPSRGIKFNLEEVASDHFQRTPPDA